MRIIHVNSTVLLLLSLSLHFAAMVSFAFVHQPSIKNRHPRIFFLLDEECFHRNKGNRQISDFVLRRSRYSLLALASTPTSNDDEDDDDSEVSSESTSTITITETTTPPPPSSPSPSPSPSSSRIQPNQLSANEIMLAMGTNPRRIVLSTLSATGIALAGNFLGLTSNLLTMIPEDQVEAVGIDTYFPRGDFKRCKTNEYTFVIPKEWVADTFVELAKAQRRIQPLDYSMRSSNTNREITTLPDAAYGPAGRLNQNGVSESGDTNVSVIVSSGLSGFTLQGTLGTPTNAATTLLSRSIAPEGSGRVATLLNAEQVRENQYKFEYIVDRGERGPQLRNIAVIAASPLGDKLFTLTVVAPDSKWQDTALDAKLRKIADSFHLR